jgi:hypothetical protein
MINEQAELGRVSVGVRGLIERINATALEEENVRINTWLVVGLLNFDDGDDTHEAPVIWCEMQSQAMKLGLLRVAQIDLEDQYRRTEDDD